MLNQSSVSSPWRTLLAALEPRDDLGALLVGQVGRAGVCGQLLELAATRPARHSTTKYA